MNKIKCVCGYVCEMGVVPNKDGTTWGFVQGDAEFVVLHGHGLHVVLNPFDDTIRKLEVFACPKCGTLKVNPDDLT